MTTAHTVTSEVMFEKDAVTEKDHENNSAVSKFFFKYPSYMRNRNSENGNVVYDEDGDLVLDRNSRGTILIEHSIATELKLVGLQIWRGALLLGDYILSHPEIFQNKTVLELGSGVGLDSIVASTIAKEVICTDIDLGGILRLIEKNIQRNKSLVKSKVCIAELNFLDSAWSTTLEKLISNVDVIMAADVIYDDKITEGFVRTLAELLNATKTRCAYVALEKRYVFTIADLDSVAPMYEEFLRCINRQNLDWSVKELPIDFDQYFQYQRLKQLVLLRIERNS